MMKKKVGFDQSTLKSSTSQELIYYLLLLLEVPFKRGIVWGFSGGPVVRNPPANAGDTGSISAPEHPACLGVTKPACHRSRSLCA